MFNLNKIEPAFSEDNYGLTQTLLTYINGENESFFFNFIQSL